MKELVVGIKGADNPIKQMGSVGVVWARIGLKWVGLAQGDEGGAGLLPLYAAIILCNTTESWGDTQLGSQG